MREEGLHQINFFYNMVIAEHLLKHSVCSLNEFVDLAAIPLGNGANSLTSLSNVSLISEKSRQIIPGLPISQYYSGDLKW